MLITDAPTAAATAACLRGAVLDAVTPAALRASPFAATAARTFLLYYETYVAAVAAAEAYERARPPQAGAGGRLFPRGGWAALRADLAAAHKRLLGTLSRPGWTFEDPPPDAADVADAANGLRDEATALATDPPPGVLAATPRNAAAPYVWDAVVTVAGGHAAWEGLVFPVEVVAAATHPVPAPWVRFAPGAGVWHPNVSSPGGVPALDPALGGGRGPPVAPAARRRAQAAAEAAEVAAARAAAWGGELRGEEVVDPTVGGTLAALVRLLARPDPRWAVNAEAAAGARLAPAAYWARVRNGGGRGG